MARTAQQTRRGPRSDRARMRGRRGRRADGRRRARAGHRRATGLRGSSSRQIVADAASSRLLGWRAVLTRRDRVGACDPLSVIARPTYAARMAEPSPAPTLETADATASGAAKAPYPARAVAWYATI